MTNATDRVTARGWMKCLHLLRQHVGAEVSIRLRENRKVGGQLISVTPLNVLEIKVGGQHPYSCNADDVTSCEVTLR